jgi:glucose/arabinose dehydrogenase
MRIERTVWILMTACLVNSPTQAQVEIESAFPALSFTQPVDLQNAGDGSDRLFVVEQRGVIRVFPNDSNVSEASIYLDIQDRVDDSSTEEGLLGLAFHPDFDENGRFFVNYTSANPNRTRISRFRVSQTDSMIGDPDSEQIVIEIDRPFSNHNAGQIVFGPADGYLYITTGDGGGGGDPLNNGQNRETLLGSILRVDIDTTDAGLEYAVPPDNPFANNQEGYREEIFAYGVRNPWRISFDPVTGRLWAADVGQNSWEEIDIIESGRNYGWNIMEGAHCHNPPVDCDTAGLTLPIWEYDHSLGSSVTGGYVYRGAGVPDLTGKYIYGDFGSGRIWSLEYDGENPPVNALLLDTALSISTFGVDEAAELYLCAFDGKIYRFRPSPVGLPEETTGKSPRAFRLEQNHPNPFNPWTTIGFEIPNGAAVERGMPETGGYHSETRSGEDMRIDLSIYDLRGRHVRTLINSEVESGRHAVSWDGRDNRGEGVSSGVYLYTLRANGEILTRKMTLRK